MLPLFPVECESCQLPLCLRCVEEPSNQRQCRSCKSKFGSVINPIHPFVQKVYDAATFNCPQKCGKTDITLKNLVLHCKKVCDFRPIQCPFTNCNQFFNGFTINKHKSQCEYSKPKRCNDCATELDNEHNCIKSLLSFLKKEYVSRTEIY